MMSEEKIEGPPAPPWMQSQQAADTTPPTEKKSRRPRRTKAQMLADADARPDARPPTSIATLMAAEDTADAVARDLFVAPKSRMYEQAPSTWGDLAMAHGPLAVGVLALIVAVFALLK
jgi:hypothetical protein